MAKHISGILDSDLIEFLEPICPISDLNYMSYLNNHVINKVSEKNELREKLKKTNDDILITKEELSKLLISKLSERYYDIVEDNIIVVVKQSTRGNGSIGFMFKPRPELIQDYSTSFDFNEPAFFIGAVSLTLTASTKPTSAGIPLISFYNEHNPYPDDDIFLNSFTNKKICSLIVAPNVKYVIQLYTSYVSKLKSKLLPDQTIKLRSKEDESLVTNTYITSNSELKEILNPFMNFTDYKCEVQNEQIHDRLLTNEKLYKIKDILNKEMIF